MLITRNSLSQLNLKNKVFNRKSIDLIKKCFDEEHSILSYNELKSFNEFVEYKEQNQEAWDSRLRLEVNLSRFNPKPFDMIGIKPITGEKTKFGVGGVRKRKRNNVAIPNFRENLINAESGLSSRLRAIILALDKKGLLNQKRKATCDFYLTEQITPLYRYFDSFFNKDFFNLIGSEYLGENYKAGEIVNGVLHENLTSLSFGNETIDTLVTLEVLEHIYDYKNALTEMYRVLKADGDVLITVPFALNKMNHVERAKINNNGTIEHLLPPEYHGDPVNPKGGILCYRYYGWELLNELKQIGFKEVNMILIWSVFYGVIGGPEISIIHAKK